MSSRRSLLVAVLAVAACSRGPVRPAEVDTRNDACAHCRMMVSDARFAAQLAAPGEEPRFFDDVGCLRDWLREHPGLPRGAAAFVADHRTRAWIPAARAVYTRCASLETPMSSHLVAHADEASRAADAEATAGERLAPADVFGPAGPPGATP